MSQQMIFAVGVKFFCGSWEIRRVNLCLDSNNSFLPIWPKVIKWDDADFTFYRVGKNGRVMYEQIKKEW